MFLRCNTRKKDGQVHRYWSVVENRRLRAGHTLQRVVLSLGEINGTQQAAWRRSLQVLNEATQLTEQICLFPEDREILPDALNGIQVKLSEMTLQHPRVFGDCWLACRLWDELHLGPFWRERLPDGKAEVPWFKVLRAAERAPTGRSGQQVAFAPALVPFQRDGPVARGRLRRGGQEPPLRVSGPH